MCHRVGKTLWRSEGVSVSGYRSFTKTSYLFPSKPSPFQHVPDGHEADIDPTDTFQSITYLGKVDIGGMFDQTNNILDGVSGVWDKVEESYLCIRHAKCPSSPCNVWRRYHIICFSVLPKELVDSA